MANRDTPNGLRPAKHLTGGTIRYSDAYRVASAYGSALGRGMPVILTGTGREIAVGTAAGAPFCGVVWGFSWTDTNGVPQFSPNWVASTATLGSVAATAYVYDDPDIIFQVQSDEDVVEADIGQTGDFVFGTVDTTTGWAEVELDSSDIGTGANAYIYDIVRSPDNEVGSNFTDVLVLINEHAYHNAGAARFETV